jgi:hypothetical protein
LLSQLAALKPYQRVIAATGSAFSLGLVTVALFVPNAFPLGWAMRLDLLGTGLVGLGTALNPMLYNREASEHPFRQWPLLCKVLMGIGVLAWVVSPLLFYV